MASNVARQRKLLHANSDTDSPPLRPPKSGRHRKSTSSSSSANSSLKFSFACLLISVTLLVFLCIFYTDTLSPLIDHLAIRLGYNEKHYACVIDAGSTGSRVLAYEFHLGYVDSRLVLDRELFLEIKPGLSAYAAQPDVGAQRLTELLDAARRFVPASQWAATPIVLKATAGLRLLPATQADELLAEVRRVLGASGFLVPDASAVEIMDGTDEGIFSWFTVNFLLGTLAGAPSTVAALDLGGGSTQVTFVPRDPRKTPSYTPHMHAVPAPGAGKEGAAAHINVFTHSYLGLGLMAVRYGVFSRGAAANETQLSSECVNPIVHGKRWTYASVEYAVSGRDNGRSTAEKPVVDWEECRRAVRELVVPLVEPRPVTLKQSQMAAFSYYFERAVETGLVDLEGGDITVGDIQAKAKETCATPNTDQPFMCLDITYIGLLLEEGFGLQPQAKLKLYKKINGHEISWALGCAYNLLQKQINGA